MNILVAMPQGNTRETFITDEVTAKINRLGNTTWNETGRDYAAGELSDALAGMDVCIAGWGVRCFDSIALSKANNLKIIAYTGGSAYGVVSDTLYDRGIRFVCGNQLFAESVAEGTLAYILSALRDIPCHTQVTRSGGWRGDDFYNEGLLDKKVGLVGFGAVARELVRFLKPFRVDIHVYDPYASEAVCKKYRVKRVESLKDLIVHSSVISVHAANTPETRHMLNRELLSQIPDGALLVNTARGEIIEEEALIEELQKQRFKAVLDVWSTEPAPEDCVLRKLPNVLMMPHMAGPTVDRRPYITLALLEDVQRFFKGKPLKYEISLEYAKAMSR